MKLNTFIYLAVCLVLLISATSAFVVELLPINDQSDLMITLTKFPATMFKADLDKDEITFSVTLKKLTLDTKNTQRAQCVSHDTKNMQTSQAELTENTIKCKVPINPSDIDVDTYSFFIFAAVKSVEVGASQVDQITATTSIGDYTTPEPIIFPNIESGIDRDVHFGLDTKSQKFSLNFKLLKDLEDVNDISISLRYKGVDTDSRPEWVHSPGKRCSVTKAGKVTPFASRNELSLIWDFRQSLNYKKDDIIHIECGKAVTVSNVHQGEPYSSLLAIVISHREGLKVKKLATVLQYQSGPKQEYKPHSGSPNRVITIIIAVVIVVAVIAIIAGIVVCIKRKRQAADHSPLLGH